MDWEANLLDDRQIIFRSLTGVYKDGALVGDQCDAIEPGQKWGGQIFAYWRAFLEERGGKAVIEMVTHHINPPCFPCPPEGCPQHPRDQYDDMSRQIEHWRRMLRKRARRAGDDRVR